MSILPNKLSLRVKNSQDSSGCPTEQEIAADTPDHRSPKPVIGVIYYSTYGHIATLAEEVIKGLESTGAIVKPYVMYVEHSPALLLRAIMVMGNVDTPRKQSGNSFRRDFEEDARGFFSQTQVSYHHP